MGIFGKNNYEDGFFTEVTPDEPEAAPMTEEETTDAPRAESVSFPGTEIGAAASLELKVVRPEKYEDASDIADHLLAGRTVVLNMDFINKDVARRLIDFLSGVAYSIHGQFQRVATGTFIITPRNVEVSEATRADDNDEDDGSFEDEISYEEV